MSMIKFLGAGALAIAAASPAAAQYGYGYSPYASQYGYNQYGYNQYGYGAYGVNTSAAAQQCSAAVQSRLYNRVNLGSILGSLVGIPTNSYGRVVAVTRINQRSDGLLSVRGLASSGRYAMNNYGPYGVGAYGGLGYSAANTADLSFRCTVAPNGAVYNVSINRR